jgi:ABC-2 type transport system permease protein
MSAMAGQLRAEFVLVLRDKGVVTFALFFPVLTIAFFGYLNRGGSVGDVSYASFLIAGGVGMVVSSAAFENLGVALARQRDVGILKRLGGTPLRAGTLVAAKVLTAAAIILVQALVMMAVNVVLFGARITGSPGWGLAALALGTLAFAALGLALAGLSRNTDVASAAARALSLPMQFLCGTLFPLDSMPPVLRQIAEVLPLTYFVKAFRGAILLGQGPADRPGDWLILLGCLVAGLLVAVKTFRWEA